MSFFSFLGNPIALAAVTVAAIGVIVYQIISQQNEERVHANGRNKKGPGSGPDSSSTSFSSLRSDVRRRKPDENSANPNFNNSVMKQKSKITSDLTDTNRSNFDEERYKQNVFDKIEKDVKNFNQKDEKIKQFDKNIIVSNCDEINDSENLDETEVIDIKVSNANQNVVTTQQGSSSNVARKVKSQETKLTNSDLSVSASDVAGPSNQDMTSSICRACEEAPAKAVAYPCSHCYLCASCATMVFRIYKRCTICNSQIRSFQNLTN